MYHLELSTLQSAVVCTETNGFLSCSPSAVKKKKKKAASSMRGEVCTYRGLCHMCWLWFLEERRSEVSVTPAAKEME